MGRSDAPHAFYRRSSILPWKMSWYFHLFSKKKLNSLCLQDFCEMLGERLVMRFNAVYKNYEEENILHGKYRFKKMKIILESFFDSLQIED